MRINLYYAPYPMQRFASDSVPVSPVRVKNPKSALATLAAGARYFLKSWGVDTDIRIIDTQLGGAEHYYKSFRYGDRRLDCYRVGGLFEEYDDAIREAKIHGVSNNYTNSAGIVSDFCLHIKRVNPDALVVVGGMDATARPEYYLNRGADVVVQFEGEHTFASLIRAVASGTPIEDVLECERLDCGLVVKGAATIDLNEIPPMSFDLIRDFSAYTDTGEGTPPESVKPPFICFETSRGCYQRCSYCATPMRGKYRYMTTKSVEEHFRHFRAHGVKTILFQEDNILSRIQRTSRGRLLHDEGRAETLAMFQMAREYGFAWEFANGLEFGKFWNDDTIDTELMQTMFWSDTSGDRWRGCYRTQVPLEYLGEAGAKQLPKLRTYMQQKEILDSMMRLGVMNVTFNVIIGHDDDDDDLIETYLSRCIELKEALMATRPDANLYFNIFNRTLLPGTQDFKHYRDRLSFDIERDPEVISVYLSPMGSKHLTYYQLFEKRLRMTSAINGEMIDQYDGTIRV